MLAVLSGCGESGPKLYPVTGKVTIGGQPAGENIRVVFSPVDEKAENMGTGLVAADGTYKVLYGSSGRDGLLPGKYHVYLQQIETSTPDEGGMYGPTKKTGRSSAPEAQQLTFPDEWSQPNTTPMQNQEVTAGPNTIDVTVP